MSSRSGVRLSFAQGVIVLVLGSAVRNAPAGQAQSPQRIATPGFEVASIKACKDSETAPSAGRKGSRGGTISADPGRLHADCATLRTLIRSAYILFANGKREAFVSPRTMQQEIHGSPSWIDSARYTIDAKAESPKSVEMMRGPMLQALLEERFNLKMHREAREMPVYELRVAKGGPKFGRAKEGGCILLDRNHPPPEPAPGKAGPRLCGVFSGEYMYGTTMENFCRQLSATLDRDVIDRTGLTGAFDLHFQYPPPDDIAAPDIPNPSGVRGASAWAMRIEAVIPRLGLRLNSVKGMGEVLVIDHVERPSEN